MSWLRVPLVLVQVLTISSPTIATTYAVYGFYDGSTCDGTPNVLKAVEDPNCTNNEFPCYAFDAASRQIGICTTDYISTMRNMFPDSQYILQVEFNDTSCSILSVAYGFHAPTIATCYIQTTNQYRIGTLSVTNGALIQYFDNKQCTLNNNSWTENASALTLSSHACDANSMKWYSSLDSSPPTTYMVYAFVAGNTCDEVPYAVQAIEDSTCTIGFESACSPYLDGTAQVYGKCTTDSISTMRSMFHSSEYIIVVSFNDSICSIFKYAFAVPPLEHCDDQNQSETQFHIGTLSAKDGASIQYFNNSRCTANEKYWKEDTSASMLSSHACDTNSMKWYSSLDDLSASSSGSNSNVTGSSRGGSNVQESNSSSLGTGPIVGIVCGILVALLIIVGGIFCLHRRALGKRNTAKLNESSLEDALWKQPGVWNDDVIIAKRVPRDKIKIKKLISRGAYGEVYNGVYNRQQVAVKMLLPATRGNLEHVSNFLKEAKMTASMDHPHIVQFIGVAWDSLSDVCVALEFMDSGDLRTLLNKYEVTNHPIGFDKQKATIALHVCHALTYLHSLMPPVIHRDLKSRNILLNRNFEAKLTDFGISKERLDQTMTAGVGTSLWMAPEVMLGDNYDVKADMFSFGVVLSELDVHTLPYTLAKQRYLNLYGRKMADATLLQKITTGEIRVDFSGSNSSTLAELVCSCVAVDPADRPTAAEALYRLQVFMGRH